MASPSEQCIRSLGEKLKKVGDSKVDIDLGDIVLKIGKQNNKARWYRVNESTSKEINFLNNLGRLKGISIAQKGVVSTVRKWQLTSVEESKYPKISFENKEAVKTGSAKYEELDKRRKRDRRFERRVKKFS